MIVIIDITVDTIISIYLLVNALFIATIFIKALISL